MSSMKKQAAWLKKQMYKELYSDHRKVNQKQYMEGQKKKMTNNMTEPELKVEKMLKGLGIAYECQKILDDVIYDFYIPEHKVMVEVDGDYYHGNPAVYQEHQLNGMQLKNKKNDIYKDHLAKGLGYDVIRFWEKDINEKPRSIQKQLKQYAPKKWTKKLS